MQCGFCKSTLSNKWSLKNHQKTSKKCLKTQNKNIDENAVYPCLYCDKKYALKQHLSSHLNSCSVSSLKYEEIKIKCDDIEVKYGEMDAKYSEIETENKSHEKTIIEKEKEIAVLKAELKVYKQMNEKSSNCVEEIAKQPKHQINSNTQNNKLMSMTPFDLQDEKTKDRMSKIAKEHYSNEYFADGQRGMARFAVEKLLTDESGKLMYICTDVSRQIFKHRTPDGNILKDVKANKLSQLLGQTVIPVSAELLQKMLSTMTSEEFTEVSNSFMSIKGTNGEDNDDFRGELATLTSV